MSVAFRDVGQVIVLELTHGVYEGCESDEMEARLLALVRRGARIAVDLSQATLTAHCLGVLANAQRVAAECGGRVALFGATRVQRWLLGTMGLTRALPIYRDREQAVRNMSAGLRSVA